jgi:hypothetical protein
MFRTIALLSAAAISAALIAPASAEPPKKFVAQPQKRAAPVRAVAPVRANPVRVAPARINTNVNVNQNVKFHQNTNQFRQNNTINRSNVNIGGPGGINRAARVVGPGNSAFRVGPGRVNATFVRPANFAVVRMGNHIAPVWRGGPRRIWSGGGWRTFAPLTALGVVALGGAYYYPDAYLSLARPYCSGITPDGCRLNWQAVAFEGGGEDWQCVQYCPRQGEAPPARTVAFVAPPPLPPGGACEISIFSEPGFAGTNATASDEQPNLGTTGWQNQIASAQVKAGTWDMFSDPEFTGETMRLAPGDYADLGPEWTKHSGSLMCVQP